MSAAAAATDLSIDDLAPAVRQAMHDLILVLADSKRLLGIRYADWVLGAPELEACIAASSLAQDEWGHARILYALMKDFGEDPRDVEHQREASDYRNIELLDSPFETWAELVIANALVDTALTVQLAALTDSRYATLRQRVRKQLDEEQFHFGHGSAWLRRLGRSADEVRSAVRKSLGRAWPAVLSWFGPDGHDADLKRVGLSRSTGGELRATFIDRVGPILEKSSLRPADIELDFSGWDPARRRSRGGGPDPDALARARGDRNRAFLMD